MTTFETILLILLVLNAFALGVLVLIQQGKGADVGAAFGSGSSSTMFGGRGPGSFLVKATTMLAVGFFAITLGLAYIASDRAAALQQDLGIPSVDVPGLPADNGRDSGFPDVPRL